GIDLGHPTRRRGPQRSSGVPEALKANADKAGGPASASRSWDRNASWVRCWARSVNRRKDAHDENEASPLRTLRVEGLLVSGKEPDVAAKTAAFSASRSLRRGHGLPRRGRKGGCFGEAQ